MPETQQAPTAPAIQGRAGRKQQRRKRTRVEPAVTETHHITVDQVARHWGVKALAGGFIALCLYAGGLKLEGIDGGLGQLKDQISSFRAEAQASREAHVAQLAGLSTRVDLLEAQAKAHEREGAALRAEWRTQFEAWRARRQAQAAVEDEKTTEQ